MNKNPDEVRLNAIAERIDSIRHELFALKRESAQLQDEEYYLRTSLFVIMSNTERFYDHLVKVEYATGFYKSIEDAIANKAHKYPEGWAVYNLNRDLVRMSP